MNAIKISLLGLLTLLPTVWTGSSERRGAALEDDPFPALLSETGYFADVPGHAIGKEFRPYRVNVAAWADGADKLRFFRLPEGGSAQYVAEGAWDFPVGTVLLQTLVMPLGEERRRVETRTILIGEQGLRFATYVWRKDQREADLVTLGKEVGLEWDEGFFLWEVTPTRKCIECHNSASQTLLGMTTAQLNVGSQLSAFEKAGVVRDLPPDRSALAQLVDPHDPSKPLDQRARSYLDTNCSPCHRPQGNGSGALDLRHTQAFDKTGLGPKKEVVLAGRPFSSWIYLRMIYDDRRKMPGLLTSHTDERGADLILDWVRSLAPK